MDIKRFCEYLKTGTCPEAVQDAGIGFSQIQRLSTPESFQMPDWWEHDRIYHPNGYDETKDTCKLREYLAAGDDVDTAIEKAEKVEKSPFKHYKNIHNAQNALADAKAYESERDYVKSKAKDIMEEAIGSTFEGLPEETRAELRRIGFWYELEEGSSGGMRLVVHGGRKPTVPSTAERQVLHQVADKIAYAIGLPKDVHVDMAYRKEFDAYWQSDKISEVLTYDASRIYNRIKSEISKELKIARSADWMHRDEWHSATGY